MLNRVGVFEGTSDLFSLVKTPLRKRKEKQTHLLGCDDFRAENAREEHAHTGVYARTNFQARFDRDAEDVCARVLTKLSLLSCFLGVFLKGGTQVFVTKKRKTRVYTMTERKSSRKTLTPKRFIPEETEKKDKDASGGQKSGGSKVRLIS